MILGWTKQDTNTIADDTKVETDDTTHRLRLKELSVACALGTPIKIGCFILLFRIFPSSILFLLFSGPAHKLIGAIQLKNSRLLNRHSVYLSPSPLLIKEQT
jgi:hypothetical protein